MISTSRWPAWCTLPFSQRKVALSETIHSLLGTLFFYPLPPMKTFHFVQLLRAPFYLLDKMRFTQLLIKANSIFKFTLLIFFFFKQVWWQQQDPKQTSGDIRGQWWAQVCYSQTLWVQGLSYHFWGAMAKFFLVLSSTLYFETVI